MPGGYVYIMVNSGMPGLVKIGKTSKLPEGRSRDLYATGVPYPFFIAHSEALWDYENTEREIHERLAAYRENPKREFFRIPVDQAIEVVKEVARKHRASEPPGWLPYSPPLDSSGSSNTQAQEPSLFSDSSWELPVATEAQQPERREPEKPPERTPVGREKRRYYDVWIVEANTVYREVPFDVVADWVQQGRLLEDDMLRPSGTADWFRLGDVVDFAVYMPKPQAPDAEPPSPVEPMEAVETGFTWRRRSELEETDVDMIPLIDVSLVLLIFFMLTTRDVGAGATTIPTPPAEYASVVNSPDEVWVGLDLEGDGPDRVPVYSCGVGNAPAKPGDSHLGSQAELLQHLQALIANMPAVDLTINAHPQAKSGDVRQLTVELEREPFRSKIKHKYTGVSDKQP